jgi:FAD synthetase
MKKVMAFGTFDIFHPGHEKYLSQAKKLGNFLIVVVARDETVLKVKKQKVRNGEQKRKKILIESGLADEVVLGSLNDRYAVIEKYRPDVIALGYDQKVNLLELKNKLKEFKLETKIVRLKAFKPEIYKSSKLIMNKKPTGLKKNVISKTVFAREIELCRELRDDKGCGWGKCATCGVVPLLIKLHKEVLIEDKEELKKVRKEIFKK